MGSQLNSCARAAYLALVALAAPATIAAQVVVRGIVYDDSTGARLAAAGVLLVDPRTDAPVANTKTDSVGQFILKSSKGVYQIAAVREGYTSVLSAPVDFVDGEQLTIRIPIATGGDPRNRIGVLEHTKATAASSRSADNVGGLAGVARRRLVGTGVQYDRSQLEKSTAQTVGQFLEAVPGVSIRDPNVTSSVQMTRGVNSPTTVRGPSSCHVGWFIDGQRIDRQGSNPLTDGLSAIRLDDVEALEVFRGLAEMPPEFAAPDLRCGAVALWMRRG